MELAAEAAETEASDAFVVAVAAEAEALSFDTSAASSDAFAASTLLWMAVVWSGVTPVPL
jgi:hypothetical protein